MRYGLRLPSFALAQRVPSRAEMGWLFTSCRGPRLYLGILNIDQLLLTPPAYFDSTMPRSITRMVNPPGSGSRHTNAPYSRQHFVRDQFKLLVAPLEQMGGKGHVSNMVEMSVHAGTHIDSPHHFFSASSHRIEQIPVDSFVGEAIVLDLTAHGHSNARISADDLAAFSRGIGAEGHNDRA